MDKRYETMMGHGVNEAAIPQFESLGPLSIRPYDQEVTQLYSPFVGPYTRTLGAFVVSENTIDRATTGYTKYVADTDEERRPFGFGMGGGPLFSSMLMNVALLGPQSVGHIINNKALSIVQSSHPYSALLSSDLMFLEAAGTGYQEGVARSAVLPDTDPRHFWGVKRHAAVATAVIEHTIITDNLEGRDIVLIGGSYAEGFLIVQIALNLTLRGIKVRALVGINGHYDYALQDYHQRDDPRPFVAALPAMAMAHSFHEGRHDSFDEITPIKEYERVAAWSHSRYKQALSQPRSSRLRKEVAQEMAQLIFPRPEIGSILTHDYLLDHDLRIDPITFTSNYFPDREMSLVESRYTYPEFSDEPHDWLMPPPGQGGKLEPLYYPHDDSAVDIVFAHLLAEYQRYYNDYMNQPHTPLTVHRPAYHQWAFTGVWQQRRSHEAMALLLAVNPDIHIWHAAGIYDLVSPPERARIFWQEMQQRIGVKVDFRTMLDEPFAPTTSNRGGYPLVNIRLFPTSHLMGGLSPGRDTVSFALNHFLRSLAA